jgi:hypothetical protein
MVIDIVLLLFDIRKLFPDMPLGRKKLGFKAIKLGTRGRAREKRAEKNGSKE